MRTVLGTQVATQLVTTVGSSSGDIQGQDTQRGRGDRGGGHREQPQPETTGVISSWERGTQLSPGDLGGHGPEAFLILDLWLPELWRHKCRWVKAIGWSLLVPQPRVPDTWADGPLGG